MRKLFLLRVEVYREVGFPSAFASVHSSMMISLGMTEIELWGRQVLA